MESPEDLELINEVSQFELSTKPATPKPKVARIEPTFKTDQGEFNYSGSKHT